jgi:hypothetical protein
MHLVLLPRTRLAARYGAAFPAIDAALTAVLDARARAGIISLLYDPEVGLPAYALPPIVLEPAALIAQLEALYATLTAQGGIIKSLWIVGGAQVVPFATTPNPMADSDGPIPLDNLYGLATAAEPLARWPVGRTPDADPPEPDLFVRLLTRVAAAHRTGPRPMTPVLTICAERWTTVTTAVRDAVTLGGAQYTAPPLTAASLVPLLAGVRLLYANVHGIRADTAWYGQAAQSTARLPVLTSAQVPDLTGALVVTQACYGARLNEPRSRRSLALTLLAAGADGLIATHVLAYGAPDPPPGESDRLVKQLFAALQIPDQALGDAFLQAHANLLRILLRTQGNLSSDDLKTLLSFVLYADPALRWSDGSR